MGTSENGCFVYAVNDGPVCVTPFDFLPGACGPGVGKFCHVAFVWTVERAGNERAMVYVNGERVEGECSGVHLDSMPLVAGAWWNITGTVILFLIVSFYCLLNVCVIG